MPSSQTIRKGRHRFLERTLLTTLWCGALTALYMYYRTPMRVVSTRELAAAPTGGSGLFSPDFAEPRLFTELPPVEPLAAELASLRARMEKHRRFRLVLDYVIENHLPP